MQNVRAYISSLLDIEMLTQYCSGVTVYELQGNEISELTSTPQREILQYQS